ncbi:HelD family protein [Actinophytocola oryzae]|uniref:HelD family protein n=1 Tax=Actinophytocola oryzae TaxID=502181 RepID=UPI001FB9950B|nr:UvrD-helicase domain-containing protein [Actinophytocola oryzae]
MSSELGIEQDHLNALYARLDALRDEARAALERGHSADVWRAEVARLSSVEDGMCFGRLDLADGRRVYVGRIGLFDGDEPLLIDWRAPAARAFYTATAAAPGEVLRRRRISTRGRTVVALDDELLDADASRDGLVGEAALLASVTAERTGRMRDIVTTLQAEQDRIIRDDHRGVLVVQGGPGTGKTAVALHRVAYLLYTHEHLRARGVLVVGPSRVFLDYIGQVLPGLGENRVVTATVPDLFPGFAVTRVDTPAEAERKGRAGMATRLKAAVRAFVRVPEEPVEVRFEQQTLTVTPELCRWAVRRARAAGLPHNPARLVFQRALVDTLTQRLVDVIESVVLSETGEALDGGSADGSLGAADRRALEAAGVVMGPDDEGPRTILDETDRSALRGSLLADPTVTEALDEIWPELTPAQVLGQDEWSAADIPLLDEAAALVGGSVPVFGHVVVDEAQELSEMDWRMLARRCPARSMTVVGDLGQTGSPAGASSWERVLGPRDRLAQLTVNYRTPAEIMDVAGELLAAHHPGLAAPRSVRVSGELPWRREVRDLAGGVADVVAGHTDGQLAVIAPDVAELAVALSLPVPPDLTGKVVLLTPTQAKGLEFDEVLIVDPAAVLGGLLGHNDLYVAMTRATRRLGVVHAGPPPAELAMLTVR